MKRHAYIILNLAVRSDMDLNNVSFGQYSAHRSVKAAVMCQSREIPSVKDPSVNQTCLAHSLQTLT